MVFEELRQIVEEAIALYTKDGKPFRRQPWAALRAATELLERLPRRCR